MGPRDILCRVHTRRTHHHRRARTVTSHSAASRQAAPSSPVRCPINSSGSAEDVTISSLSTNLTTSPTFVVPERLTSTRRPRRQPCLCHRFDVRVLISSSSLCDAHCAAFNSMSLELFEHNRHLRFHCHR